MPDGREGGDDRGRRARWQLLGAGGPDSRVAGQEADGREPDGTGAMGSGGPDGWERGGGMVHEDQMAVAGGSGGGMEQEFKMMGRQGPDQGVRSS